MDERQEHSRRDFLQGKAAAHSLVGKVENWADSAAQLLTGISPTVPALHVHASRRAMACEFVMQFHEADSEVPDHVLCAFDLIEDLETQMTIYRDSSEVIAINETAASGPVQVEQGLFQLLELAAELYESTDGAFDITSGPLSRVWGFLSRVGRMPVEEELAVELEKVGFDKVVLDSEQRTIYFLKPDVEINLNSVGKGLCLWTE